MSSDDAIKNLDTEELYRLCTRYLEDMGRKITSVKKEDDILIETIGQENGMKEILYIKKGDLNPKDVKSLSTETKTRIITLGGAKVTKDIEMYKNIELMDLNELTKYLNEPIPVKRPSPERALPSITEVERTIKEAKESFARKDYEKALEFYSKVLSMKSSLAPVWAAKGETYRAMNDYDSALECYKNALHHNVKNGKYWFNMGTLLYMLGRHEEEVECYEMAIKNEPGLMDAWNNKGVALYQLERYEDAILCYDVVLKNDSRNEFAWNNKGLALKKLNKKEDALKCFDEALALNRTFVDAFVNKGVLLYESRDYNGALESFDEALKLREDANVIYHRGMTMYKLKDYKGALTDLREVSDEISHAKSMLSKIEKLTKGGGKAKGGKKKDYPCFGEYDSADKGCQTCKVSKECGKDGK